ncbi:MAG TPA: DUF2752 domain-containing protein [Ignavibacteriales bacterium]|nr:DUF2752 domain-containing protein [Ignavibacteriales bacterium]
MISKEFRQGFFAVWAILSLAAFIILLVPFIFSENTIYSLTPLCESRRQGLGQCPLCGMTRAFIDISKGDFSRALTLNRFSLALYGILVINLVIFLVRNAYRYFSRLKTN